MTRRLILYTKQNFTAKGFFTFCFMDVDTFYLFLNWFSTRVSDNRKYVCGRKLYACINTRKLKGLDSSSLRSCPLPIIPLCLSREEGIIHFFVGSHVKKPESGLFSDWIGNNTDDLRCSNWPKCRHPLVVVDFSLHFCLRNEQWIHTRVRYKISAGSVFLNLKNA